MSFGLYAAGYAIVIIGLVYAAHLMHIALALDSCRRDRDDRHWASVGREGHPPERPRLIIRIAAQARQFKFLFPGITIDS